LRLFFVPVSLAVAELSLACASVAADFFLLDFLVVVPDD
jgi:hypothetical protein